jgi:hypothetical protein
MHVARRNERHANRASYSSKVIELAVVVAAVVKFGEKITTAGE